MPVGESETRLRRIRDPVTDDCVGESVSKVFVTGILNVLNRLVLFAATLYVIKIAG